MTETSEEIKDDHLYVCEYDGQETISLGADIELWNEGLEEGLTVRRSLGRIVHSWVVTEAGVRERRMDHVTDAGKFVMIPTTDATQSHPVIVEDADPTLHFPTELFTVGQINTAVKGADPEDDSIEADELAELQDSARAIADRINDGIEAEFEARYEEWRAGEGAYPEGKDFAYEIPLAADWKRRVVSERTDLSAAQVELLATVGFPSSMRVTVDVDVPDAAEDKLV